MAALFKLVVTFDRFKRPVFLPTESDHYVGPVCFDLALNDADVEFTRRENEQKKKTDVLGGE